MKKLYFFISLFLFSILGHSQIVNIPDSNFKICLLNQSLGIDTNLDNEIQVSEALATTSLNVGGIIGFPIQDLTGLSAFSNLEYLEIGSVGVSSLDLNNFLSLQTLLIREMPLTSLDVSALTNLRSLTIDNTSISTIGISNLTQLSQLYIAESAFEAIHLSGLPSLVDVSIFNNQFLSSFVFTNTPQIKNLNCFSAVALQSVDISELSQLENLSFSSCGLTTLNLSGLSQLQYVNCQGCGNLTSLISTGANAIKFLYCNDTLLTTIEVAAMTSLEELFCGHSINWPSEVGLTSLNVSGLTQLKTLNCEGSKIAALDVSTLTNLTSLNCSRNLLTSLNVSPLNNLRFLDCSFNQIGALDVQPLTSLTQLNCSFNQLNVLNVETLTNLEVLNCGSNHLLNLNLTNLPNLKSLGCFNNQLSVIDISQQTKLSYLSCGNNLITNIDLSHIDISYLNLMVEQPLFNLDSNPNLEYVNMKFGPIYFYGSFLNCPSLRFICIEEENRPRLLEIIAASNNTQEIVSNSYCSFSPGGQYNTLAGTITFDTNNTGCTVNAPHLPQIKITLDDGNQTGATFTNSNGNFTFFTQVGNFIITPEFENPYFAISPTSATVNFATSGPSSQIQSFCVAPLGIHYDGEITIIPITTARPGFDASYKLIYKNQGNQTLSGNINLIFNDDLIDFASANPAISSQTTNNLNWVYSNLLPFETREIDLTFNVNSPQELPAVNNGDLLNFKATIGINAEEETMENNISNLDQIVVGSFDPNDKACLEGNTISPERVGNYLHYLIRFQNSGTAAAENVVVKDIIDTNKFDISSLQLTSSSHPQVTKITGNKVEFQFQNINLPAEIDDEPGSHGYIAFKIKTKANLVIGDSVSNKADIYFDYNFPIETNTATATVSLLGVNAFEDTSVTVVPNPVKNQLKINSKDRITSVQIFDLQGRILETLTANNLMVDIDFHQKSKGTYFVKVITEKGSSTKKIIKD